MRTLQLLCPEHRDGAAHLGERAKGAECAFDFGTPRSVIQSETIVFPRKVDANFVSTGALPVFAYL